LTSALDEHSNLQGPTSASPRKEQYSLNTTNSRSGPGDEKIPDVPNGKEDLPVQ